MTSKKGLLIYLATILNGWLAFFSINIAYALFTLRGFIEINEAIILLMPLTFISAFGILVWLTIKNSKRRPSAVKSVIFLGVGVVVGGWALLSSVLYCFEHDVLYTNRPVIQRYYKRIQQQDNMEEVFINTSDGAVLQGFLFKSEGAQNAPLAIYFGGRGEEASAIVEFASKIKGRSLAFINYRGCGLSTGKQSEERLFSDALEVYDYFASREDIDQSSISVIGHSLGTGVAVHLASQRDVKAIVLSTPYDRYTSGVIGDRVPLIPVGNLLSDKLDSLALGPEVNKQALFLLAEKDTVVLRHRSMRLFESWGGEAEKVIIGGTHHKNIIYVKDTWDKINTFLNRVEYK